MAKGKEKEPGLFSQIIGLGEQIIKLGAPQVVAEDQKALA
jgi:hypothetical protein